MKLFYKHPILTILFCWFVVMSLILFAGSIYENSKYLRVDETGKIVCNSGGKYGMIRKPACFLTARIQGKFFWESQRKLAQNELFFRENYLGKKSNIGIGNLISQKNIEINEIKVLYEKILSDKQYELEKIKVILSKYPNDSELINKFTSETSNYQMSIDVRNSSIEKIDKKYDEEILQLQNKIDTNPIYISSLKKILYAIVKNL